MLYLIIGLGLFFGLHSVSIIAPAWRDRMFAKVGEGPWKGLYSLLSIVGFVLMIYGYGLARRDLVILYSTPVWVRYITAVLMLPVFPLLLAAYLPGRIKAVTKHPMLAATKFWALAHLLVNGALGDVLLFGSFLVWAVADRISLKRRPAREIRAAPAAGYNDMIAVVLGLVLYALFVQWLHIWLFGVSPLVFPK
jgi:uncharacterized membrane protein